MNTVETGVPTREDKSKVTTPYRLVFPHGVANLTLRADTSMPDTYRGAFMARSRE